MTPCVKRYRNVRVELTGLNYLPILEVGWQSRLGIQPERK